jgi:prepilin-type N-terminal cleavage/methylation domain-containing protein
MRYEAKKRALMREDGFTLPEVLVAMVMMLTVMFALYSIFDMSLRVFSFGNDKTEAVENARVGMERMEREIRAAYPVDKVNGDSYIFFNANGVASSPPQTMPSSDQVTFGSDLDGDREVSCPNSEGECEYITYRLSSDTPPALLRNNTANGSDTSTGGDPLAEFVIANGLTFTYCKSANDCPPSGSITEDAINLVRIELEVVVDRGGNGEATQTLTTDVALRNRTG